MAILSGAHTGISLELKRLGGAEVFTRGSLVENIVGLLQTGRPVRGAEGRWPMGSATVDL